MRKRGNMVDEGGEEGEAKEGEEKEMESGGMVRRGGVVFR